MLLEENRVTGWFNLKLRSGKRRGRVGVRDFRRGQNDQDHGEECCQGSSAAMELAGS